MEKRTLYEPVMTPRGEVIGIGKIEIPRTADFDHKTSPFSFLSIKESENSYISTCIHLRIDGCGTTEDEAGEDMIKKCSHFLSENFRKLSFEDAWDNLQELFKADQWSNRLWDIYHLSDGKRSELCLT